MAHRTREGGRREGGGEGVGGQPKRSLNVAAEPGCTVPGQGQGVSGDNAPLKRARRAGGDNAPHPRAIEIRLVIVFHY